MASPDLTKLQSDFNYNSFKNNRVYTGSQLLSATTASGITTLSYDILLDELPDLTEVEFNGPADSGGFDLRPADAWFKKGVIGALGTDVPAGYVDYPTVWIMTQSIVGNRVTIKATNLQQFTASLAITPVRFYYKIIDYSVF